MYALTNWLIIKALSEIYDLDAAKKICAKWVESVMAHGFREMYNPLSGEGLGSNDYSPSTIIVDSIKMIERNEQLYMLME